MAFLMAQSLEQLQMFRVGPTLVEALHPKVKIHRSHASRNKTVSWKLAPFTAKSVTISCLIILGF